MLCDDLDIEMWNDYEPSEGFWSRIKRRLRAVNGSQGDMTFRHITEAIYRRVK